MEMVAPAAALVQRFPIFELLPALPPKALSAQLCVEVKAMCKTVLHVKSEANGEPVLMIFTAEWAANGYDDRSRGGRVGLNVYYLRHCRDRNIVCH